MLNRWNSLKPGFYEGIKLIAPVEEDGMVSYADVTMPEGGFAHHLLAVQEKTIKRKG